MKWQESLRMAGQTLLANKLRSSLTMLGIVIGNASVIAMVAIGEGAQTFVTDEIQNLGPNTLFVVPGNRETQRATFDVPRTLVYADAEAIASQVASVQEVAPEYNSRGLLTYRNRSTNITIVGTTPGFPAVRSFEVASGRFLADADLQRTQQVVVLGADLAARILGDRPPVGETVRLNNRSFEVVGVLAEKGSNLGLNYDDAAIVPLTTMARRLVGQTSPFGIELTYIAISVRNEADIGAAEFQVTNLLRLRHNITGEDDFTVQTQQDLLQITGTITGALTLLLTAIAAISLLVGGIGIMNIMLVSVKERTQEIGLRKAIGASQEDILLQFLIEAVILAAAGGVLGTTIGVAGTLVVGAIAPFQPAISLPPIVVAVGVSGGIGLFFGVIPARQAAKLDPIVALRSA